MKKNKTKIKDKLNRIIIFSLIIIFGITFALFFSVQYKYLGLSSIQYFNFTGLNIAFGLKIEGGRDGFFPFFLPVLVSALVIVISLLIELKKLKKNYQFLFIFCAGLALLSSALYLVTYFYESGRYEILKNLVSWTWRFWMTFGLYCLAFVVSAFGFFCNLQKIKNTSNKKEKLDIKLTRK